MRLTHLRWAVPVAILAVGFWLLAPLLPPGVVPALAPAAAPALAPAKPPVAEAPVEPTRPAIRPGAPVPAPTARLGTTVQTEPPAAPTSTPAPMASPTPSVYRASPVENLKIEPRATELVRLGRVEKGMLVRMTLAVRFNVGISNLSGTPDVDVQVVGPSGTIVNQPNARDGAQVRFEAPASGDYELRLDNSRSRVNAKRVGIQFG